MSNVFVLPDYKLSVQFSEGVTKLYDVKPLFDKIPAFKVFEKNPKKFSEVSVDTGGYGIVWNDELDLSCDELWEHGEKLTHPLTDFWHSATQRLCGA